MCIQNESHLVDTSEIASLKLQYGLYDVFQPLKHMIGFDYFFVQPMLDSGISFRSDEYLSQCRVPILILHADNDWIVPASLGRRVNAAFYCMVRHKVRVTNNDDSF